MFYRYEVKNSKGDFVGAFCLLNPSQHSYFNRYVKAPKWYDENPDVDSRCWFTEIGYQKYHEIVENLIAELGRVEMRLLTAETLQNVVFNGKIQCIQLAS